MTDKYKVDAHLSAGVPGWRLFDTSDVQELLHIKKSKLFELLAAGDLKSVRIGSRRFVRADELERFVASLSSAEAA